MQTKIPRKNGKGRCNDMLQRPSDRWPTGKPGLASIGLPLLLQHLDDAGEVFPTVPRNAVRRVDRAGHAAQWGAGFHGCGVFLG